MTDGDRETIGLHAHLACVWEATARKPGNVHRFADFDDLSYLDFLTSAAAVAPVLSEAPYHRIGYTVLEAVQQTRQVARTNSNLGILLLLAPLSKAAAEPDFRTGLLRVLDDLGVDDSRLVYEAIRLANPSGLGQVAKQDIKEEPTLPLRAVMALAAERDLIALQYVNGFREVLDDGSPALLEGMNRIGSLEGAIQYAHLCLMARHPDSLIARKRGAAEAMESAWRAQAVLDKGWPHRPEGRDAFADLDAWLRGKRRQRNPGTTADVIAACLFVLLRERKIALPLQCPWSYA